MSGSVKPHEVGRKRILVVDDDKYVCESIRMLLEFDNHEVSAASSAEEALVVLAREKFDTIFTDYLMPGMRGDEFAREVKKRNPSQPIVMITAYAEVLQSSNAHLNGIDFIICKPFLLENLREAIVKTATSQGPLST